MSNYDVVIVGGGPSGCSSALELTNLDPGIADRLILLDKAIFPRPKLCAGGVSVDSDKVLSELGLNLELPAVPVHQTQFLLPTGRLMFHRRNQFRVLRRFDLDHSLLNAVRAKGVIVHEGEEALNVFVGHNEVIVRTTKAEYEAKILIAADGANSRMRATLGLNRSGRLMIAMEVHAPLASTSIPDFAENSAVLDLRVLDRGLPGYCWAFPAVSADSPILSLGIMAAPMNPGDATSVKGTFCDWLSSLGLDPSDFKMSSHPALRYDSKAPASQPRVLFVGDAAGVEPLFGEGIVSALAYGKHAGTSALAALRDHDFSFSNYEKKVRTSPIGSLMRRRRMIAKRLYAKPRLAKLFLKQGTLIRGLALLHAYQYGGRITWKEH